MLNSDNWLEIMMHLDLSLPSLILTCHLIYKCYQENKKLLCHEGNYRFSSYQHQLSYHMNNHMDKNYNGKLPLLIETNNNKGTKAAVLSACIKYKGTVVIMCHKKDNFKWKKEINQLYNINVNYKINNKNYILNNINDNNKKILICDRLYCDRRLVQYASTHDFDPNLLGYKVVIVNKGNIWEMAKHSMMVVYKMDKELGRFSNNTVLFGGKVKTLPLCNYIEYPHIKPIINMQDLCCYHDEGNEIFLPPINDDHLYKMLNERLDNIITNIIIYHEGPYLIIGEHINTSHALKYDNLRSNDISFITYQNFNHKFVGKFKTLIVLWPAHSKNNVYHMIDKIDRYRLNVFNIHSTIEEKYLRFVDKTKYKNKIDYLVQLREFSSQYDF